jgi:hypothetical protein
MSGFNIKIEGLEKTFNRLDYNKIKTQIQQSFDKFGINTERLAKLNAPVDEGHLRSAIYSKPVDMGVEVGCAVNYAAYLEFGTRKFAAEWVATLPPEWQQLAAQFKGGGGGSFEQLVLNITEWVHRKGLGSGFMGDIGVSGTYSVKTRKRTGNASVQANQDRQIAYMIALKIVRFGIPAQPFLYPAVNEATGQLLRDLKNINLK